MDTHSLITLFSKASEAGASDVHIIAGSPILFRINGALVEQTKQPVTPEQAEEFVKALLQDARFKQLKETCEMDTSFSLKDGVRLRVNCSIERGNMSLAARIIPQAIPSLEQLGLTEIAGQLSHMHEGLILFTGPTGAGKSTSLASLIDAIAKSRAANVVTLEDPIEFYFNRGLGAVRQREFGQDFHSFPEALKHVLRQDPDVVMVGEMRDPETVAAALTLAETGHLIFATLHTPNVVQAVDRIIDVFPPHQQAQARSQLSLSLKAVISQRLVPKEGGGRIALREVLYNIPAVAHIIRDSRAQELRSVMQTNESIGMITFERAAKKLHKDGAISKELYDALAETI